MHAGGLNHTHAKLNLIAFIPKARTLVKKILSECIICKKKFSRPMKQQMAPLPNVRVQRLESRTPVFDTTMLDCAGPFFVVSGRRKIKRWILLLTCAQFRAIHLEVISGLDTTSFLRGLNRFMARRPRPSVIISDNGTNFRGLDSELQLFWQSDDFKRVQEGFPEIRWRFNPPAAPHHGGAFERLVRSVKEAIKTVIPMAKDTQSNNVNEDEFNTAMVIIEGIINSRPISHVDLDDGLEALTPSHFLCSSAAREISPTFSPTSSTMRKWRDLSKILDSFWTRYLEEVTPFLQRTQKWIKSHKNAEVGDVVQVLDKQVRGQYVLGKIIESHVNKKDGLVRVVLVKTKDGEYTRPIDKLSMVLPVDWESN